MLDWIQPRLPEGYRAYLGSVPALTIDANNGRPDRSVRKWEPETQPESSTVGSPAPDSESVAVFDLDPLTAVHIDYHGQLVAALEIVSLRNKDRPDARARYLGRYLGYIRQGVHLLLIDVLPRPVGFSFADALAENLRLDQPPTQVPYAVSYRVGESVPDGTLVAIWRRPLAVGQSLPTIPLALTVNESVAVDLEYTYAQSARRVYLT